MVSDVAAQPIQIWPIDKLIFYARNPRKNDSVVDRMCGSIREFGFKIPVLARSDGELNAFGEVETTLSNEIPNAQQFQHLEKLSPGI